ncbi:hypothetical protein KIPB_011091 [Kipferlia bialata]|uniref:Uncharacterized protein n=1 Tax=Kipferlia bialata TaxID=797122 RepID=A0A9K3D706_9EUKA|nr:hypothetical protein KIPB_011091 [Kipferlia bialata]|eukprot:g11091.t1
MTLDKKLKDKYLKVPEEVELRLVYASCKLKGTGVPFTRLLKRMFPQDDLYPSRDAVLFAASLAESLSLHGVALGMYTRLQKGAEAHIREAGGVQEGETGTEELDKSYRILWQIAACHLTLGDDVTASKMHSHVTGMAEESGRVSYVSNARARHALMLYEDQPNRGLQVLQGCPLPDLGTDTLCQAKLPLLSVFCGVKAAHNANVPSVDHTRALLMGAPYLIAAMALYMAQDRSRRHVVSAVSETEVLLEGLSSMGPVQQARLTVLSALPDIQ